MTLGEKLKKLRSDKNITQEELAEKLFVSRTAVSKWETDKGYPNLESLMAISKLFEISINDLLSGEDIVCLADEDKKRSQELFNLFVFVCSGIFVMLMSVLPLFANNINGYYVSVNLFHYQIDIWMKIIYHLIFWNSGAFAIAEILAYNLKRNLVVKFFYVDICWGIFSLMFSIISKEPYVGLFLLILLMFKMASLVLFLVKKQKKQ